MLYLSSSAALLFLMLLSVALGRQVVRMLPRPVAESVAFFVAPLLGLAGLTLVVTLYGWISPFKTARSVCVAVGLLGLSVALEKDRQRLFRDWLIVAAFALVATLALFAPAIRFDAFNPISDTFTYLVHGQWLQEHAFSEPARLSGFYPAETQVALYQAHQHRMGASFLLAFVQSLFHFEWSYYAYLPAVALPFTIGCLAMGGVVRQAVPVSQTLCVALCLLPAMSLNGFLFGAQFGFFPQTFGLAFAAGLACLIPASLDWALESNPGWKQQALALPPLTLCFAALLISYNDIFAPLAAGIAVFAALMCFLHWKERKRIISLLLILALEIALAINVEAVRILSNFVHTILGVASGTVRFGWPVRWATLQFVAHSFGMKSSFDNGVFLFDAIISRWVFPLVLPAIAFVVVRILRSRPISSSLVLLLCVNAVFWAGFLRFRYAVPALEGEVGNTFLQFKLAKWLALFNLGLMAIVFGWTWSHPRLKRYRPAESVVYFSALAIGLGIQFAWVAPTFMRGFQDETQREYAPFQMLLDLRSRVADIPKDRAIYLAFGVEHDNLKHMAMYVMSDRKLASTYGSDVYVVSMIPPEERDMPPHMADWMIQMKPRQSSSESPLSRIGPLLIRGAPISFFVQESISGAYPTERDRMDSWNWIGDVGEYRFRAFGKAARVRIRFNFLLAGPPRTLLVEMRSIGDRQLASFQIAMPGGWGSFESPPVEAGAGDVILRFRATGERISLAPGDVRSAKFLIQNLTVEAMDDAVDGPKATIGKGPAPVPAGSPVANEPN